MRRGLGEGGEGEGGGESLRGMLHGHASVKELKVETCPLPRGIVPV